MRRTIRFCSDILIADLRARCSHTNLYGIPHHGMILPPPGAPGILQAA